MADVPQHGAMTSSTADRLIFLVCFLWGICMTGYVLWYRTLGPGGPRPVIACDSEKLDLGEIDCEPHQCVFTIHNIGQRPLLINNVKPGCGDCVSVLDFTKDYIQPGSSGNVALQVNGAAFQTDAVKVVTVFSNDMQNPRLILSISAQPMEASKVSTH